MAKTMSPAKAEFVRDFLEALRVRHKRGDVVVPVREIMRSLGSGPEEIVYCWQELKAAGVDFHHTDRLDSTLPTVESRGEKFSYIGAALRRRD